MTKNEFMYSIVGERARLFSQSVAERLHIKVMIRELPGGLAGMIKLFVEPALKKYV